MDTDLYEGDLLYTPVVKKWYYEVVITDIAVGGESLNLDCKKVSCYMSEINTFWTFDFFNIIFLGYIYIFFQCRAVEGKVGMVENIFGI